MTAAPVCPYCQQPSQLVDGDVIYPRRPDLWGKGFYLCAPCKAYVGCHPDSNVPLGSLANPELRAARSALHAALDPIWKSGTMRRSQVYYQLSKLMNIPVTKCHVGMFDLEQCASALANCKELTE